MQEFCVVTITIVARVQTLHVWNDLRISVHRSEDGQSVVSKYYKLGPEDGETEASGYYTLEPNLLVVPLGSQLAESELHVNIIANSYLLDGTTFIDSVCLFDSTLFK